MKKTININLGGLVFQIDEDAFDRLNQYLEALKNKFNNIEERNEIIQDIEYRFAELFNAEIDKSMQVVSLKMVNKTITTMGSPEEIEEDEMAVSQETNSQKEKTTKTHKKLFRDPDDQVIVGVLSGLSKYFGIQDPIWFRIGLVLLTIASIGIPTVPIYLLLWIVTPLAKTSSEKLQMNGDSINLDNIENQVKKNINTDEIKRTTARIANKAGEIVPFLLKVLGIGLIIIFSIKLIALTFVFLGLGVFMSLANPGYTHLITDSNFVYYSAITSLYVLIATPIVLAIYLAVKIFTKRKINWIASIGLAFILFFASFIGVSSSSYSVFKNFKLSATQTNYVALENPAIAELNIEFPFEKLEDNLNININIVDDDTNIEGFKVNTAQKEIYINMVALDIEINRNDSIFKLSKTVYSKGETIEKAQESINHIMNNFEQYTENTISIPKKMILKDETKWRNQKLSYKLYVPVGKKIYFSENAKKVIEDVEFNGEYRKRDLANNTWEMTDQGLICISCKK